MTQLPVRLSLLICLFGGALALRAQSWEDLRGLRPGDRIVVQEAAGTQHKGTFASVSAEALTLRTEKSEVALERARIRRVQVPSGARRARNAILGAAIGIAIGVTVDQTLGTRLRNEGDSTGRAAMYAAPTAALAGIGAALPAYRTVYKAR
jgi:hypothetical protein